MLSHGRVLRAEIADVAGNIPENELNAMNEASDAM